MVHVDVIYVMLDKSLVQIACELPEGSMVMDALVQSGIFISNPETRALPAGIFSKRVTPETMLHEGDRIELYRPLKNDPKDKRRQRAKVRK